MRIISGKNPSLREYGILDVNDLYLLIDSSKTNCWSQMGKRRKVLLKLVWNVERSLSEGELHGLELLEFSQRAGVPPDDILEPVSAFEV